MEKIDRFEVFAVDDISGAEARREIFVFFPVADLKVATKLTFPPFAVDPKLECTPWER